MNFLNKLGLLLVVLVVMMVAGCASKEATNAQAGEINVVDDGQISGQASAAFSSALETEEEKTQKDLAELDPYVDPDLADQHVAFFNLSDLNNSNNVSCLKMVRMEFDYDNRDFEDSPNWGIKILLENCGERPVYLNALFGFPGITITSSQVYKTLKGGDRVWINLRGSFPLGQLPIGIDYSLTEKTVISSEFENLKEIRMIRDNTARNHCSPFIDLYNVSYVIKNEEKGWASVVLDFCGSYKETGNRVEVYFLDGDGYGNRISDYHYAYLQGVDNTRLEIPLGTMQPEEIYGIVVRSYKPAN